MRALAVLLLATPACTAPRPPTTTAASARNYPAPLYAGLFAKGALHTYTVESTHSYWDDQTNGNVEETFTSMRTCTVTDVQEVPSAIASRIECVDTRSDPFVSDAPAGVYVATADGLWSVAEMPRVAPTTTKDRLFAWPPVASDTEERDPQDPGWGTTTTISQAGPGWCRSFTFISGDEGDEQLCVADGIVVSGSASSAGGSSYAMTYTLATK